MAVLKKLEQLARIIPGVAGYQDKEAARETDKAVRVKCAGELEQLKRGLEEDKRFFIDKMDFSPLPELDRIASKLDKLANLIRYAGRGYTGVFDDRQWDPSKLDQLCHFDVTFFEELESVKARFKELHGRQDQPDEFKKAAREVEAALDRLETIYSTRQELLASQ